MKKQNTFSAFLLFLFFLFFFFFETPIAHAQWNNWCYKDYYGRHDDATTPVTTNATFTVPAGCDYVIIEAIGAGGGGGYTTGSDYAGGGGGGAYARCNQFGVTPGETISISIGHSGYSEEGMTARRGGSATATYKGVTKVCALGGTTLVGSDVHSGADGAKTTEAGMVGDVKYSGGEWSQWQVA